MRKLMEYLRKVKRVNASLKLIKVDQFVHFSDLTVNRLIAYKLILDGYKKVDVENGRVFIRDYRIPKNILTACSTSGGYYLPNHTWVRVGNQIIIDVRLTTRLGVSRKFIPNGAFLVTENSNFKYVSQGTVNLQKGKALSQYKKIMKFV